MTQTTRTADRKPTLDRQLFLVVCSHKGQAYVAERDLSDMDSGTTLKQIAAGEWTNLVSVIVFNPAEHICTDVTEEFARAVQNLWANSDEPLTDWQRDFIEQHISIQAANAFATEAA